MAILQLSIYDLFLKPIITTWGASKEEVSMRMVGDDKNLTITSTRAISINASKSDVWKWLIQLGADRGGFYSYDFIEKAMGYKTRHQDLIKPEFKKIETGDLVRGSIDEKSSIIPYNFRVLYVKPEETFVLDKWGIFLLKEINSRQTRLIIRTQEAVANYIMIPFHFIMERRTLMGIKARAEAGENVQLSESKDVLWFSAIVLSGFLICFFIFIARGFIQSIIIPFIFSLLWSCSLLLFDPTPWYSMSLLLVICVAILNVIRT
ncbi:MAG: hypothetical protein EPO11_10870 [Gammaproteobacteria bacterium]|nr:MAG: hypothetical protein EPO11_10870 [Gammaproteobacteria bacterium]